jgi:hypothetical protein
MVVASLGRHMWCVLEPWASDVKEVRRIRRDQEGRGKGSVSEQLTEEGILMY